MDDELEFFDSNILIAASVKRHLHHAEASKRLLLIPPGKGVCAAHTLAETYNTLTKKPPGFRMPPKDALRILHFARATYTLVTLTGEEMLQAIEAAANRGLSGPIIYDVLLLACARKVKAKAIYTNNLKHFSHIAPDLASKMHLP